MCFNIFHLLYKTSGVFNWVSQDSSQCDALIRAGSEHVEGSGQVEFMLMSGAELKFGIAREVKLRLA